MRRDGRSWIPAGLLMMWAWLIAAAERQGEAPACSGSGEAEQGTCRPLPDGGVSRPIVGGAPGLVLIQGRYVASIDVEGKRKAATPLRCAAFGHWPDVDRVTCGNCQALVLTRRHNQCDSYCGSFGHVCVAAAEEVAENCEVKRAYACNEAIQDTSDILCTCRRPYPGESVPTPPPAICGGGRSCANCDELEPKKHAGCFVVAGGKLLAIRVAYGSQKFDLPGGQSSWTEPASCTAHRQTFEETGYEVAPTELLAADIHGGGFNLYRCELLSRRRVESHDSEVAAISWLSKEEVQERLDQNLWRFPEAKHYVEWMR